MIQQITKIQMEILQQKTSEIKIRDSLDGFHGILAEKLTGNLGDRSVGTPRLKHRR